MSYRFALLVVTLVLISSTPQVSQAATSATTDGLSLELIMQDPDWLGRQPQAAWWNWDGSAVLYQRKRAGNQIRDMYRVTADGRSTTQLAGAALANITVANGDTDAASQRRVVVRHGDIFLRNLKTGALTQLTRTAETESAPFFMVNRQQVAWQTGDNFYIHDLSSGLTRQAAVLKTENDPAESQPMDYLEAQQQRLFSTLRDKHADAKAKMQHDREQQAADPSQAPLPFWLGADRQIVGTSLSPAGNYLIVVTQAKDYESGQAGSMPNYVTASGYVEDRAVRTLVGRTAPAAHEVLVLDLAAHALHKLDTTQLLGIKNDPLADLREAALEWHVEHGADRVLTAKQLVAPAVRPVAVENITWGGTGVAWSDDGRHVAIQFHSIDNKDRWLTTVDFAHDYRLITQERLTDPAWINWDYNDFGWLPGSNTLWYLSEASGYSHLYVKPLDDDARQLTDGTFEVSSPQPDADGNHIYFIANQQGPGWHDIYRVAVTGGKAERLTTVGVEPAARAPGTPFTLSPDETQLLFYDGSSTRPPELYTQALQASAKPVRLTETISDAYLAHDWIAPGIVQVPSSHVDRPIQARLYLPRDYDQSKTYPAVLFVHGAGYLQDAHSGWSSYFREFMFNNLLIRHGYVVLDMDYRASAGYGRDWRTAIYRQMGHPELEDLQDGVAWLVKTHGVDAQRVGVYGGSYGGFMTFMAMFRAPELFAAGAALRPVTDWVHYNHEYTSNILNTPLLDPVAYQKSSPIEWAEQYANRPLIMFHGMQDDNVFFKDTVRLVQRLLELHKKNYWPMFYPLDPHGFIHADSWLDEYRRIYALFEENLKTKP